MQNLKIAIVEDQKANAEQLSEYIAKYFQTSLSKPVITVYETAENLLKNPRGSFDIVFMDIELPGIDGLSAAKEFRTFDERAIIVFVTNMAQLAIRGYEVNAIDFIVKPLIYSDFAFKFRRIERALGNRKSCKITVNDGDSVKYIERQDILFVEVTGHKLIWHLKDETIQHRAALSHYEEILHSLNFLKCNRCYLVNPEFVKKVEDFTVTVGNEQLQISRPQKKIFMQQLNEYVMRNGQ